MTSVILALVTILGAPGLNDPIVLQNRGIRVEVDPDLFTVTHIGTPRGVNFLRPLPVTKAERTGVGWVEAGGLHTDLIPYEGSDPALRRGPAEVVEHTPNRVVLIGPPSKSTPVRLKKEIRIYPGYAKASMTVTVEAVGNATVRCAVRNTARCGPDTSLRIEKSDGAIRPLAGTASPFPSVVKSRRYWIIPIPPTTETSGVVLGAFVPKVTHQNKSGTLTRRILTMPAGSGSVPNRCTFLCLLDDETRCYTSALQGATLEIRPGAPAVFKEEWTIKKRGR